VRRRRRRRGSHGLGAARRQARGAMRCGQAPLRRLVESSKGGNKKERSRKEAVRFGFF
jgi:hypothetical protein